MNKTLLIDTDVRTLDVAVIMPDMVLLPGDRIIVDNPVNEGWSVFRLDMVGRGSVGGEYLTSDLKGVSDRFAKAGLYNQAYKLVKYPEHLTLTTTPDI